MWVTMTDKGAGLTQHPGILPIHHADAVNKTLSQRAVMAIFIVLRQNKDQLLV